MKKEIKMKEISRRKFVKTTVLSGAGACVLPYTALSQGNNKTQTLYIAGSANSTFFL
jgi:hypothetical protein